MSFEHDHGLLVFGKIGVQGGLLPLPLRGLQASVTGVVNAHWIVVCCWTALRRCVLGPRTGGLAAPTGAELSFLQLPMEMRAPSVASDEGGNGCAIADGG